MNDSSNHVPRLRYEKVNKLIELINQRELATSAAQYNAETEAIKQLFALIKCPIPNTFMARLARQRQPWVQILEALLAEMARGFFDYPFKFDQEEGQDVLMLRTSDVMAHLRQNRRDLPLLSDRVLKKHLKQAGVLVTDRSGDAQPFERTLGGKRVGHLAALRLSELHNQGLNTIAAAQAVCQPTKP